MRKYYSTATFLIVVLALGIIANNHWPTIIATTNGQAAPHATSWVNGQYVHTLEEQYDQTFSVREFAINAWTALTYSLFDEGKPGLIVGKEGWLFTQEEFIDIAFDAPTVQSNLDTIAQADKTIREAGGRLLVVVLPSKSRVYSHLLKRPMPNQASRRHADFTTWLDHHNLSYTTLLPALINHQIKPTFLSNDTHWTPYGAKLSAVHIANRFKSIVSLGAPDRFNTQKISSAPFKGDMLNYLPLTPYFEFLTPQYPTLHRYVTEDTQEMSLFDDIEYEGVLVGTSYSAKEEWNFLGALQQHTGLRFFDASKQGHGPFTPMLDYIASEDFSELKGKPVVWEIPERYLAITPINEGPK